LYWAGPGLRDSSVSLLRPAIDNSAAFFLYTLSSVGLYWAGPGDLQSSRPTNLPALETDTKLYVKCSRTFF
jgi:hypothetical protein